MRTQSAPAGVAAVTAAPESVAEIAVARPLRVLADVSSMMLLTTRTTSGVTTSQACSSMEAIGTPFVHLVAGANAGRRAEDAAAESERPLRRWSSAAWAMSTTRRPGPPPLGGGPG